MGFDNECILNIQSLPGEYFCPVCRTLIYPNEALQSQCTHLYCKPCLAYVVATTRACPYDGYLVTETDSKPLVESNKSLAETIGKVAVRCLYYRSGCQWQGGLSECVTHCAECTFGNSAVICNRCGTQILHRQVQEHGQTCPGMQPQGQAAESQAQDSKAQVQAVVPDQSSAAPAASSAAPTAASAAAPTAVTAAPAAPSATAPGGQGQIQSNAVAYQQAAVQAQTPDQWYQQQQQLQYQQYYQQYPGYDPYQQQYQQYAQYQQQAHPQYAQQQMPVQQQVIQGQQQQPQYVMPQPQVQVHPQHQPPVQPQPQPHPHPQPQVQPQPQAMPQSHPPTHPQAQPQLRPQTQPYPQLQPHLQQPPQLQPQTQPQLQTQPVPHPQPHAQVAQPHLQQQYPQSQPQPQIQPPVQQLHASAPQPHAQSLPLPPPHSQPGGQLLQPQPRPNHPQPQPHHLMQPSQIQATPQHLQSLPPQQHPHAQMQHPQSHLQQQPPPHSHPLPQHQQPHTQPQAQPMPQPHPFPQPQPQPLSQHPSAQAVSGHQSYPQPQPVQQYPMPVPTQQHNPQHPMQAQNQFPQSQTSQMRPPHSQLPVQVQQPNMVPPQGPHASIGSSQSQAHHLVQQGQQMHQYPGMQLRAQPQGAHVQPHPGQSQQMHPQQQLHAQGHQYMQQQGPVQPQLQQSVAPAMSHEAQVLPGRSLMPNQGMQQPPYQQSPASNKPLLGSVNQQSPNKSYPARATVQHDQLARPESQVSAALQSGSQPNPLVSEQNKQSADLKTSKSEVDFKSENREATAADVTEEMKSHKDSKVDEDGAETHLNAKDTKEQELKPPVQEDARESSDAGKESSDKGIQNSVEPSSSAGTMQPENINSQGQTNENIAKNIHVPSQHNLQQQNNIHDLHRPSAGQGSYPVQPSSFGQSPKMRPPAPERMFPEQVPQPGPNQDRKLPGPPPQMQVFGQAPPSAQMGPPLRNIPETFPYQGQPSMAPHGSYPSQVPHPSLAGPDVPPSSTMPPGPFGHQQNYMPPPHSFGPTNFQGQQPLGRPGIGAPPSGPGGSAFGMENQMGPSQPPKSLETERYGVEKAGFSGWQHEPRPPALGPFGQPHAVHPGPMSTNGLPKERYGPVPEENFRPFPEQPKVYREERIVPSTLDLKRFEEDMKRFPRPDHLDREGRPPYDGHMSSTRPFDMPQPFGGPFPPSSGGLAANPTDYGDRMRPLGHHEDLGRRSDPLRGSGGEYTGSWQGKFGSGSQSHMNDFTSRDSHGFDERSKALSLGRPYGPGSIRKDIDGTEVLPSRFGHVEPNGFGGIHNLRMGDPLGPGNLSTSRHGYPGETKTFNSFPIPGGMDSIEYSKMRKPGSMGLCRICKIDCETVEGLDLHSQTREHQKMAMHMVLSIKQENAKRQKLNYEGNVPFEDANRARKPNFESHMNWA